jgi:hypothetical protein
MSGLIFSLAHEFTHADAANKVESELRRIAQAWETRVVENRRPDGARDLEFQDESFSGTATLHQDNRTSVIKLKVRAHWMISVEATADVLIEDQCLTVNADVPFLLRGRIRRELQKVLGQALRS